MFSLLEAEEVIEGRDGVTKPHSNCRADEQLHHNTYLQHERESAGVVCRKAYTSLAITIERK